MIKRTRKIVEADMPVKLEALKSHLRIADDAFDADLLLKLHTATQWAEAQIGRTLNTAHTLIWMLQTRRASPYLWTRESCNP